MKNIFFLEILCCLLVLLFGYTGVSKLIDLPNFRYDIAKNFPFLSAYSSLIGFLVPILELLLAVLLIVPKFRVFGLYGSFVLMLFFTFYVARILSFSKETPCTCGGVLREMSWGQHLWFNIFFTTLSLVAILLYRKANGIGNKVRVPGIG